MTSKSSTPKPSKATSSAASEQRKRFLASARKAGADESEANWEARLKAVGKHQPPMATIGAKKPRGKK